MRDHKYLQEMAEAIIETRRIWGNLLESWTEQFSNIELDDAYWRAELGNEMGRCASTHLTAAIKCLENPNCTIEEFLEMQDQIIMYGNDMAQLQLGYKTKPKTDEDHAERATAMREGVAAAQEADDLAISKLD